MADMMVPGSGLPGFAQTIMVGDERTRRLVLEIAIELNVREIILDLPWADLNLYTEGSKIAREWFKGTFKLFTVENGITVYPRLFHVPPLLCLGRAALLHRPPAPNLPPDRPEALADFLKVMLDQYAGMTGKYWQIWNKANHDAWWSHAADPKWEIFAAMVGPAMEVLHDHGKKVALGGIIPPYEPWISWAFLHRLLKHADALVIHAFPKTLENSTWLGWPHAIDLVQRYLAPRQEVWIGESGFSVTGPGRPRDLTSRAYYEDERIKYFNEFCGLPVEKKFWSCAVGSGDPDGYDFGVATPLGVRNSLHAHWEECARRGRAGQGAESGQEPLRLTAPI